MLNQTPLVLQMLGAKNLPVNTTYGTLKKVLVDKHKLPADTVKQVPAAMADPVMVFKSATQAGDLVMMQGLKDQHGATVIVPVALEQKGKTGYVANIVTSMYGQKNTETLRPNNQWFANQISNGNLLYQNKKKSREWSQSSGLQLPRVGALQHGKKTIHTEADLVKLREANPTLYAGSPSNPRGSITLDTPSGRPLVSLFEKADSSTFLHESGHLYLEMLRSLATFENAPPEIRSLWEQAKTALGVQGEVLTTEHHEQWSASMEAYFMRGEAPSLELRGVFDHFEAWLKAIYNTFRSLGKTPSEDLYPVFDRLFASDEQLAEVEAWHEAQKPFAAAMEKMEAGEREAYLKKREKANESARIKA